jgi:short-subunit dehydrogenase
MFETTSLVIASAASVAQAGYDGFRRGRRVVVPGMINKIHTQSVRFGSRRLITKLAAKVNQAK